MTDTNVFQLSQPGTFTDPLTEVLRTGARALLAQALEAEHHLMYCDEFCRPLISMLHLESLNTP